MKRNILFYMPSSALTGGPRVLLNFLTLLDRDKINPFVVLPEEGPLVEEVSKLGVPVQIFPLAFESKNNSALDTGFLGKVANLTNVIRYNITIANYIECNSIDLVWARNIKAIVLIGPGTKWRKIPLIWDIGLEKHSTGWIKHLHNAGLWLADKIVTEAPTQPEQTFGNARSRRYATKLMTIDPGISEQRIEELRHAKALPGKSPLSHNANINILNVGTICTRKNQLFAVQAINRLANDDIALHLVGGTEESDYLETIRDYVASNKLQDKVFLYGWRDDIPAFMAASDMLLMTSTNEGIPYTVHESMHIGLPAIVADAGGMASAVSDGVTGYVFPVNNMGKLISILHICSQNKAGLQQLANEGIKQAKERYSAKCWYQKYEKLLLTLTESSNSNSNHSNFG